MYEPVNEGSYIKMIDMASGKGGQIQVSFLQICIYFLIINFPTYFIFQVNNLGGYLPGRIVFFLV